MNNPREYPDCAVRKKPTNLTISDAIRSRATRLMVAAGFTSFSAFVEQLIREEHLRQFPASATNSTATLADQIVADEIGAAAAKPAPGPTSYAPARKAARRSTAKRAPNSPKKPH